MERKPYRKLHRLTPLNLEIKRVEVEIYKSNLIGGTTEFLNNYLQGLKKAKELVKGKTK